MPWVMQTSSATYNVVDSSRAVISCDLLKLNEAKVICASTNPIGVNVEVWIIDRVIDPATKTLLETHELLHGRVQKYSQVTKGASNNTYEYTVKELAVELEKNRVHESGVADYVVAVPSGNTSLHAATILSDTGWTVGASVVNQNLDAVQYRYMTSIAGLNKIVTELTAAKAATPLYMWFDSSAKTVEWGEYRTDKTGSVNITNKIYYDYKVEETVRNQVSGVVIFGANSAYEGCDPDPLPSDAYDLAVYQYDDATSDAECKSIAAAVRMTWCNDPKKRIQFKIRPLDTKFGASYIVEGDRINVDGVPYTIIDMTYTPRDVLIGVNAGEDSVLYSLGDKLRPVAGTATGESEIVWNPGTQNVSSDGTTITKFLLEISDAESISSTSVDMKIVIGKYRVYSFQNEVSVGNQYLSDITIPAVFAASGYNEQLLKASSLYLPVIAGSPYLVTDIIDNGFQYAIATIDFRIMNSSIANNNGGAYIICNYSWDGINWNEGTYQSYHEVPLIYDTEHPYYTDVVNTYMIPGTVNDSRLYVRWRVTSILPDIPTNSHYFVSQVSCIVDVLPRHTHVWVQSGQADNILKADQGDDLSESDVTPPETIHLEVNSTHFGDVSGTVDIKSALQDGTNEIKFTSTTVCTVTPSATFKMFGA